METWQIFIIFLSVLIGLSLLLLVYSLNNGIHNYFVDKKEEKNKNVSNPVEVVCSCPIQTSEENNKGKISNSNNKEENDDYSDAEFSYDEDVNFDELEDLYLEDDENNSSKNNYKFRYTDLINKNTDSGDEFETSSSRKSRESYDKLSRFKDNASSRYGNTDITKEFEEIEDDFNRYRNLSEEEFRNRHPKKHKRRSALDSNLIAILEKKNKEYNNLKRKKDSKSIKMKKELQNEIIYLKSLAFDNMDGEKVELLANYDNYEKEYSYGLNIGINNASRTRMRPNNNTKIGLDAGINYEKTMTNRQKRNLEKYEMNDAITIGNKRINKLEELKKKRDEVKRNKLSRQSSTSFKPIDIISDSSFFSSF